MKANNNIKTTMNLQDYVKKYGKLPVTFYDVIYAATRLDYLKATEEEKKEYLKDGEVDLKYEGYIFKTKKVLNKNNIKISIYDCIDIVQALLRKNWEKWEEEDFDLEDVEEQYSIENEKTFCTKEGEKQILEEYELEKKEKNKIFLITYKRF